MHTMQRVTSVHTCDGATTVCWVVEVASKCTADVCLRVIAAVAGPASGPRKRVNGLVDRVGNRCAVGSACRCARTVQQNMVTMSNVKSQHVNYECNMCPLSARGSTCAHYTTKMQLLCKIFVVSTHTTIRHVYRNHNKHRYVMLGMSTSIL